jgi:hypothetical protein
MRALTVTPPWGSLIALAASYPALGKHVETRTWPLPARLIEQPLAIHQAKGLGDAFDHEDALICQCDEEPFRTALAHGLCLGRDGNGGASVARLPRGAIVAVVVPVACWRITATGLVAYDGTTRPLPGEPERSFGNYTSGRWAWELTQIVALPYPVRCRGTQGLWVVPADVAVAIDQQLNIPAI